MLPIALLKLVKSRLTMLVNILSPPRPSIDGQVRVGSLLTSIENVRPHHSSHEESGAQEDQSLPRPIQTETKDPQSLPIQSGLLSRENETQVDIDTVPCTEHAHHKKASPGDVPGELHQVLDDPMQQTAKGRDELCPTPQVEDQQVDEASQQTNDTILMENVIQELKQVLDGTKSDEQFCTLPSPFQTQSRQSKKRVLRLQRD